MIWLYRVGVIILGFTCCFYAADRWGELVGLLLAVPVAVIAGWMVLRK